MTPTMWNRTVCHLGQHMRMDVGRFQTAYVFKTKELVAAIGSRRPRRIGEMLLKRCGLRRIGVLLGGSVLVRCGLGLHGALSANVGLLRHAA